MDHRKKLLELLGVASLREYVEPATFEDVMETGGYYGGLFQRAFAKGETQTERVRAETARLLAEMLQPEARKRYGKADITAIRRLVTETLEPVAEEEWEKQMALLRDGIGQSGLSPDEQSSFLKMMEELRAPFIDQICAEAARLEMISLENVNELSMAAAEMFKEEQHANQARRN